MTVFLEPEKKRIINPDERDSLIQYDLNSRFSHQNDMTHKLTIDIVKNIRNRYYYSFPVIDAKLFPIPNAFVKVAKWPKFKDLGEMQLFFDDLG